MNTVMNLGVFQEYPQKMFDTYIVCDSYVFRVSEWDAVQSEGSHWRIIHTAEAMHVLLRGDVADRIHSSNMS